MFSDLASYLCISIFLMMNIKRLKIYGLFILLLHGTGFTLQAQSDDFTTWTTMKVSHKLTPDFSIAGKVELRTKDSMKTMDRWGASLSGSYQLFPFLKAEGGYELHHRNRGAEGWKYRHRYNLGVTGSVKWQRMKFSLRERFQQTFSDGNAENRLRSRLKVGYEPKKGILSPYFSAELYQAIGGAAFFDVARMRYRPGVEIEISDKWSLDVFYCYQYEPDKSKHIVGIECSFAF